MTIASKTLLAAAIATGMGAVLSPAWANGADDGGTKAYFDVASPGSASSAPNSTSAAPPVWNRYKADANGMPVYHHRDRYQIQN